MASILLASLTSGAALSADDGEKSFAVRMSMDSKIKIPTWDVINTIYGSWSNAGSPHSCQEWGAPTGTVPLGDSFQQSRTCQQSQVRTATPVLQNKVLKTTKNGTSTSVQRDVSITEFRDAVGTGDSIISERAGEYTAWSQSSANYGCSDWTPSAEEEPLYDVFTQSRTCSKDETRSRDVFHVWSSGKETFKRTEEDSQVVQVVEEKEAIGEKDYIYLMRPGDWSEWENYGAPYECSTWWPLAEDTNAGVGFEQTRACMQMQKSSRDIFLVWRSGPEFKIDTEERERDLFFDQSRETEGTKDYIVSTTAGEWSDWANKGEATGCGTWSPSTATMNYGESFTQTRSCDQVQGKTRTIYNNWQSGEQTVYTTETDEQLITVTQNQSATGVKDYKTGEVVYGEYSEYKLTGEPHSCEAWSPSESTVNLGTEFTQERACKQSESRQRTIYDVWASGRETEKATSGSSRTVDVVQSQSATGTKDYVVRSYVTDWTSWVDVGDVSSCSNYSPSASTVNYGESFTQSRSCKQEQARSNRTYDVYISGKEKLTAIYNDSRLVDVTQSQQAVGEKNVVVSSQSTTGEWAFTGSGSCGNWSPLSSTVNYGTSFEQSQSCSRPRERTITTYNVLSDGSKVVSGATTETDTYYYENSVPATGTKDYILNSGWDNNYSTTVNDWECSSYSPSVMTVADGVPFTQTRTCTQTTETNRRFYETWKVDGRVYTGSISVYSTTTDSNVESRTSYGAAMDCPTRDPETGIWTLCK